MGRGAASRVEASSGDNPLIDEFSEHISDSKSRIFSISKLISSEGEDWRSPLIKKHAIGSYFRL